MDSNGFYSVNQNALQQPALTDFFVPDEESNLQQPPANLFALDGTGGNAGNPDSLYPYLGTMNGPFADLTNFSVIRSNQNHWQQFWSNQQRGHHFWQPLFFRPEDAPARLSALNVFAPNTTAVQNTGLEVDAPFQHSELGHIFERPQGIFNSAYISNPAPLSTSEMYPDLPPHTLWSTQPTGGLFSSCDWPGCTSTKLFSSQIAQSEHVSATHILDVLQNTSGSCTWPGCRKSKLDTSKKLETHVVNIHIEPLRCAFSGCSRTEPFGRKGDLDRHIASVHKKERRWKCPRRNCTFHIKGFPRKDKLNEHLRTRGHGVLKCEYPHCGNSTADFAPFLTEAELMSHFDDHHGNFECGIGSCANTSSAFTPRTLRSHVFHYHCSSRSHMDYENLCAIVYQIAERYQSNTCTITKDDSDGLQISDNCKECVDERQHNTS